MRRSHTEQIPSRQLQPQSSQKLHSQKWCLFVPLSDHGFVLLRVLSKEILSFNSAAVRTGPFERRGQQREQQQGDWTTMGCTGCKHSKIIHRKLCATSKFLLTWKKQNKNPALSRKGNLGAWQKWESGNNNEKYSAIHFNNLWFKNKTSFHIYEEIPINAAKKKKKAENKLPLYLHYIIHTILLCVFKLVFTLSQK